ncbi:MAG TPA: hypothetical protein VFI28_10910 [Candidatus Limnocylindrales bacterium]|nr:hypothetical protein [Candidatus Limnocylindrales bacterium]
MTSPIHEAPEHDWTAASARVMPVLRPPSGGGTRLSEVTDERLSSEGLRTHALPLLDDGPAGLSIGYAIPAGGFDVLVNADHLLAWQVPAAELRAAAMRNLTAWSGEAAWTDEDEGGRRILSSDSGEGGDATRILLPEVRRHLQAELGGGGRVIVGLPERHLLMAAAIGPDDTEFADLLGTFVAEHAASADEPVEPRLFELIDGELQPFQPFEALEK